MASGRGSGRFHLAVNLGVKIAAKIAVMAFAAALSGCSPSPSANRGGLSDAGTSPDPGQATVDPSCPGPPPENLPVPWFVTADNQIGHWSDVSVPVQVTFESSLSAFETNLSTAVTEWNNVACSSVQLSAPVISNTPIDTTGSDERRIHVRLAPSQTDVKTDVSMRTATGEIVAAQIGMSRADASLDAAIQILGNALGLKIGSDSQTIDFQLAANGKPNADATNSLCQLYGTPPRCDGPSP